MHARDTLSVISLLASLFLAQAVSAQQTNSARAVEEFAPQLEVGYEMRPRAGIYGITELMIAALEGKADLVKRFVEQGADLEQTDDTGGTLLMWAVQGGDIDIVNFLLDSGANVGVVAGRNATAFMTAVISGKEDIAVRLLDAGATYSGELSYQKDYLEYSADRGYAVLLQALIENGDNLKTSGADALCFAIKNRHVAAARLLIDASVDVNQRGDLSNDLPLIHALQVQDDELVQLLVESGAELGLKDKSDRASIMYYAAQSGEPSIVSYLLDSGAQIGTEEANQLLSIAIAKNSMEMANLFVARGATITTKHLFNAVSKRQYEMADAFADTIGIETLDDSMLDNVFYDAKTYGHQTMVDAVLDTMDARDENGRLRLLFESEDSGQCRLQTWDPQRRVVDATVVDKLPCDAELFTSRRHSSLFILQGERIDVHSIDNDFPPYSLSVPTAEINLRLDDIRDQFSKRHAGNYDWVSADIVTIGYLDNGQITLTTHTGGPADGIYASRFVWDGSGWTLLDTKGCGRFSRICHMTGVDGQSIERWPTRRAVWHPALVRNPGFVETVAQPTGNADVAAQSIAIFEFNGRRSALGYAVSAGGHCAEECLFTESVTINSNGANPLKIRLANSRVSIADQFILVRPNTQYSQLYDLGTGEDVLGKIGRATWIH